jgi:hypothetical protein
VLFPLWCFLSVLCAILSKDQATVQWRRVMESNTVVNFILCFPRFWVGSEKKCYDALGCLMQGLPEESAKEYHGLAKGKTFDERWHFS